MASLRSRPRGQQSSGTGPRAPRRRGAHAKASRFPGDWRAMAVVASVVVLANVTYLSGVFDPNPITTLSGLGTHVTSGLLPGLYYVDPNIGTTAQALGHLSALDILHGKWPWWNPYEGLGAPLAGEMQSAALFPPTLLLALSNGQVYFRLLLELVAGESTYLVLRRLEVNRATAVGAGIAFGLNGTFAWMFHAPGNPVAFLPVCLLGVEVIRAGVLNGRRRHGWVLLALGVAASLYAGFPEVAYIDALLVALWALTRTFQLPRARWMAMVTSLAAGVAAGVALAAPIVVAFVDYLGSAYLGGHAAGGFGAVAMPRSTLPPIVMPYVYGPIFAWPLAGHAKVLIPFWANVGGYLTATLAFAGLVGVAGSRDRALRLALAIWVLLGIGRSVGIGPAMAILNHIPGERSTAFFRYAPPSWELAAVVLAALGIDDIVRGKARRRLVAAALVVTAGVLAWAGESAAGVLARVKGAMPVGAWAAASVSWAVMIVGAMALAASLARRVRFAKVAMSGLVAFDALAMFVLPQFSAPRHAAIDRKPVAYLRAHLGHYRFYTLGPLAPDYGSYFGLASAAVNDLPTPKAWARYVTHHLDPNVDPVNFTGTSQANPLGPSPAQELVRHFASYEQIGVKYLLVPAGAALPALPSSDAVKEVWHDSTTAIYRLPAPQPLYRGSGCKVVSAHWDSATLTCSHPAVVDRRVLYMRGWSARLDGRPLAIHRAHRLWQQVSVHSGRSSLRFNFTPPYMSEATAAALMGLGAIVLVPALAGSRHSRHRKSALGKSAQGKSATGESA